MNRNQNIDHEERPHPESHIEAMLWHAALSGQGPGEQKKAYSVSIFKVLAIVWFKIYIKKLAAEPIYSSGTFQRE